MPEFIHSFQRGRMNKDLDERLIPNGEYRDALNLDIANSEGSNVGTLQNVKGNVELRDKTSTDLWQDNYIEDLSNPVCIGSIRHDIKETIYWFIASDNASVIAEYNQTTGIIKPVLVDKNGILNFSEQYLITGINILDKFLFWTDDQTEPKKINIDKFKRGSVDFDTHTKIPIWTPFNNDETVPSYVQVTLPTTQPDFTEEDITVIKKSPLTAPTLDMAASPFGENIAGTGITPVYAEAPDPAGTGTENFTYIPDTINDPLIYESLPTYGEYLQNTDPALGGDPDYYEDSNLPNNWDGIVEFDLQTIYDQFANNGGPVWEIGDIIVLEGSEVDDANETFEYQVRIKITSISNLQISGEIQAISSNILRFTESNGDPRYIQWSILLEEEKPMFEYLFPRFAYRWKYIDNEYSTFSPFSDVAFIGNEFKYVSSDGYNIGMTNNIRKLIIQNLEWGTEEVSEIEILYKESNNTTVYSVETIKKKDYSPYEGTEVLPTVFRINSEIIGSVIQANQLLRPWDNVPRLAKSQEIIANRIVYGNYLQNYTVDKNISLTTSYIPTPHKSETFEALNTSDGDIPNPYLRMPEGSLKTIRTYQAGVIFKDQYGRETPVVTSSNASIQIPIEESDNVNKLSITPVGTPPDWATHYKFFVKETANEYYNLALDRFYPAEDGNVWLSFPSSERNKVDEETYLILKKQHDNDVAVDDLNRYKILAIENEAPEFIATFSNNVASMPATIVSGFEPNFITLVFTSSSANTSFENNLNAESYLQIIKGSSTDQYQIASGFVQNNGTSFTVTLQEPLGQDAAFLTGQSGSVTINLFSKKIERKPEFEGRFFAKINRDFAFDTNIIASFKALEPQYAIEHAWNRSFPDRPDSPNKITDGGTTTHHEIGNYFIDPGEDRHPRDCPEGYRTWDDNTVGDRVSHLSSAFGRPRTNGRFIGMSLVGAQQGLNDPAWGVHGGLGFAQNVAAGSLVRIVMYDGKKTEPYQVKSVKKLLSARGAKKWNANPFDSNSCNDADSDRYGNYKFTVGCEFTKPVDETFVGNGSIGAMRLIKGYELVREIVSENNKLLTSSNPAIFETEPKEAVDLDIYNEASNNLPINTFGTEQILQDYFNCYSYGNGVESNRIRDDYNAPTIDKGPKVSAPLDEPYAQERRGSGMIFSQIYNSTSGINRLNQFIQAEPITKDLNPIYGTIQKLHARDTDAIVLCEDKCLRILANKDALYNADGNVNLTGNNAVLGQAVPYAGEYGISKNPESFASYAFRAYFSDKNRGAVIRLSADGITNIAEKGMSDFFADNLRSSTKILGSYDDDKDLYNITLDNLSQQWVNEFSSSQDYQLNPDCNVDQSGRAQTTVSFKESVDGWTGRKSFIPESGVSLNNIYYTFKEGRIYQHNLNYLSNNFYRVQYDSSFNVFINEMPQVVKGFSAINYTGTQSRRFEYLYNAEWYSIAEINFNTTIPTAVQQKQPGWYVNYVKTDLEGGEVKEFEKKEGKWFNYIKALEIFNDCEEIPDGIGNPDIIESDPQDYILTVTIDEDCSGSGGVTPDTIQAFVNIWTEVKPDSLPDLNIVSETSAQDVKCAIENYYNNYNQNYGNLTNEATAFSYVLADGLQVGTQMYHSQTGTPISTSGAYLFVGAGEQMSDLTVSHAGLDANNTTVVPSTYYVMILGSNGQIASWTQYNTLSTCDVVQPPEEYGWVFGKYISNESPSDPTIPVITPYLAEPTDTSQEIVCKHKTAVEQFNNSALPQCPNQNTCKTSGSNSVKWRWYGPNQGGTETIQLGTIIRDSNGNPHTFAQAGVYNAGQGPGVGYIPSMTYWPDITTMPDDWYVVITNNSGEVIVFQRINELSNSCP